MPAQGQRAAHGLRALAELARLRGAEPAGAEVISLERYAQLAEAASQR